MTHTYLLIAALLSSLAPSWTHLKSPQKNFRRRLYNFLYLKLRGHWTESHEIYTSVVLKCDCIVLYRVVCAEMTADHYAEIKIAIFQSIWKRQRDEWRSSSNCRWIAAKIARLNSVNSEIIKRKFTKFGHDVAWLLLFNLLKADLRSANPLLNAEAQSNGHSTRRLRTSPIFNWLPYSNVPLATAKRILGNHPH